MRKETVRQIVDSFPDEVDIDQLSYRIYVLDKIERGERAIDEGRFLTHEEAKERLKEWLR